MRFNRLEIKSGAKRIRPQRGILCARDIGIGIGGAAIGDGDLRIEGLQFEQCPQVLSLEKELEGVYLQSPAILLWQVPGKHYVTQPPEIVILQIPGSILLERIIHTGEAGDLSGLGPGSQAIGREAGAGITRDLDLCSRIVIHEVPVGIYPKKAQVKGFVTEAVIDPPVERSIAGAKRDAVIGVIGIGNGFSVRL